MGKISLTYPRIIKKRLSTLTFLLLLTIVSLCAINFARLLLRQDQMVRWIPPVESMSAVSHRIGLEKIKSGYLFGKSPTKAAYIPAGASALEAIEAEAESNLLLVGIVSSSKRKKNLAVLAHHNKQGVYGLGERIGESPVYLKTIFPNKVVIDKSGKDEILWLGEQENSTANKLDRRLSSRREHPYRPKRKTVGSNYLTSGESSLTLTDIKHMLLVDPSSLFKFVNASTLSRNGHVVGYAVTPGVSSLLFDMTDLEPQDVILEIGGVSVSDPRAFSRSAQELKSSGMLDLLIERRGQQISIQLKF